MASDQHLYVRSASAGSGKTYTLAAHYIALLLHGERYQSILAVTFTNKATAEMKERIVTYLHAMARETSLPETQGFIRRVRQISAELGYDTAPLTDAYCAQEAERLFLTILSDYDNMRVSTIDAFLQSLLAGMVQAIGGAIGYGIELDTKRVIADATDQLLTVGAQSAPIRASIVRYMGEQMDAEKNWDIRNGLMEVAKELYSEAVLKNDTHLVLDDIALSKFRQQQSWRQPALITALQQALNACSTFTDADFKNGKWYTGRIRAYQETLEGKSIQLKDAFAPFSKTVLKAIDSADEFATVYRGNGSPEVVRAALCRLSIVAAQCRKAYIQDKLLTKHLNDLVLMQHLKTIIEDALKTNNNRLLSLTANTLAKALAPGDADFILEKAGIRYRHIMLDEFQDTSALQWDNFKLLLQEILSQAGSTLIVGDIKQSIYRWRNGDWKIMANLPTEWTAHYNTEVEPLTCNFRSEKEIVLFNIRLFHALSQAEQGDIPALYNEGYGTKPDASFYRAGHDHGYVRLHRYTKTGNSAEANQALRVQRITDMFDDIVRLLEHGVEARDMMILIRQNKEALFIMHILDTLRQQPEYAALQRVRIISNDCFKLTYSPSVRVIIAALRVLYLHDPVSQAYLHYVYPTIPIEDLTALIAQPISLPDVVEGIIRLYLCQDGQFVGQDLAYLTALVDKIKAYVATDGSDGTAFLRYWDDVMNEQSIPASDENGIQLMTIHASKGLEAKNVFIPFCNGKMEEDRQGNKLWCQVPQLHTSEGETAILPIPLTEVMTEVGFEQEYEQEHYLQRIDNLNILYVAFTRAAERLYIGVDSTHLVASYCDQDEYGTEFWTTPAEKQEQRKSEPFSFAHAQEIPASFYSSERHIQFEQSQDSRNYGWDIVSMPLNETAQEMDRRALGTLCHELLAKIRLYASTDEAKQAVEDTVKEAYNRGMIPTPELQAEITTLLTSTVSHPDMASFFIGDWEVLCEEAVLYINEHHEVEERRMDRVVRTADKAHAIVIDYKFGKDDPKYDLQVKRYIAICHQMGYHHVQGYLWIAQDQQLLPVNP